MYSELTMVLFQFQQTVVKIGTIAPDTDGAWITPYEIDQNNPNRIVIGYNNVYESLDLALIGVDF